MQRFRRFFDLAYGVVGGTGVRQRRVIGCRVVSVLNSVGVTQVLKKLKPLLFQTFQSAILH